MLEVDDEPVGLRLTGSTDDALAGVPLAAERCGPGADERLELDAGDPLVESAPGADTGGDVDRVVLTNAAAEAALAAAGISAPS